MKFIFKNSMDEKIEGEFKDNGSKILAIMAHGFKGNKDTPIFKNLENKLEKIKINSLRFDFSGCGESKGSYSQSTVNKQAKEIRLAIKKSGYKKIILIGHSMGCAASLIASYRDKRIVAIILINPLVFPYITFKDSLVKFSPYVLLSKFNPENIKLLDRFKKLKKTREKLITKIKKEVMGKGMLDEIKMLDLVCFAKKISLPVLIIHGKNDELIPLSHAEYLNFNIKKSKLDVLNYFHNPFLDEEINEISAHAIDFIKKLKEKFLK
jgi:hypothetical protein